VNYTFILSQAIKNNMSYYYDSIYEIRQNIKKILDTQKEMLQQLEWISIHVIKEEKVKNEEVKNETEKV